MSGIFIDMSKIRQTAPGQLVVQFTETIAVTLREEGQWGDLVGMTIDQLGEIVERLKDEAATMMEDIEKVKGWEAQGLTYKQVSGLIDGVHTQDTITSISDAKFTAAEDLTSLHYTLSEIYGVIFQYEFLRDNSDVEEA